jgi:hypothetical protein
MDAPLLEVTPVVVEELGSDVHVLFAVRAPNAAPEEAFEEEDGMLLGRGEALLGARIDPRANAVVGKPLTLAVDAARFHFFDRETGLNLLRTGEAAGDEVPAELARA